ncbi:MAG: hypothetical protein ACI4PT_09685 [Candidatus Avoscillospira sp.]
MLFYCPNCQTLQRQDRCSACGKRNLLAPKREDVCFLDETEALWAGMLEDVLRQAGIPYLTKSWLGAGMTSRLGIGLERIRFYVPFERLQEARDLSDGLFHLPEE